MNKTQKEVLLIAQEECAEVTQAISKIFRFGIDGSHNERTNRERLTEELGDLHCMIELIIDSGLIDRKDLLNASGLKRHKLFKWSNIFDKETEDV
jgi:NTP pyrophosphatase (non-canonical NTP hydrolase)